MTRAIQRHTRRLSTASQPAPDTAWVNDEEFEILESGIFADETPDPSRSRLRPVRC